MKIKISFYFLSHILCRIICSLDYKVVEAVRQAYGFILGNISAKPWVRTRGIPTQGLEAGTRWFWGTRFLLVLEAKWFASIWYLSASTLCSATVERFILPGSDYFSYYLLVLSCCPGKTIWLDEFEPLIHRNPLRCRQVCGITWYTPSQQGCGDGKEGVWADLLRSGLWKW